MQFRFTRAAAGIALLYLLTVNAPAVWSGVVPGSQAETAEQQIERAKAAISREDYEGARKALKRALSLKKDSSEACLLLAGIYRIEGEQDDAFKYVKKAIASNARYVEAQTFYARLLFEAGKFGQARKQMAIALDLKPRDPNAYVLDGEMYLQESKYKEALESFEQAIGLAPADAAGTSAIQARVEAIKSYLTFKSRQVGDTTITRPVIKTRPRPNYTEEARRAGTQGMVRLGVLVSETGDVTDHIVISGLAHGLTVEAIKAARRIQFSPALRGGNPVPYWQLIEVEFKLK